MSHQNGYVPVVNDPNHPNVTFEHPESWNVQAPTAASSSWFSRTLSSDLPLLSDDPAPNPSRLGQLLQSLESQIRRGLPFDFGTLSAAIDAVQNLNGRGLDDRKFLLEKILVFLSRIPPGLPMGTRVEHLLLEILYSDLPHPPSTYIGRFISNPTQANTLGLKFAYREADGSNNNPTLPTLGAAHTPYARSVASSRVVPPSSLPDPGLLFDTLLKRDKDVQHPTGVSSLFFAFANLIVHSLFRTNHTDWSINDTSSYLDLSPLYGEDQERQNLVRRRDGTGRLWNDTFADARLLAMPPSVSALLVVFNRNHNYIATRIFEINENRTYKLQSELNPPEREMQDDDIFNRARLVNCGTFMQIIMRDYVGTILHMIPELSPWHLSPFDEFRTGSHQLSPRGQGNVCSVEFNLLYRWHATTSLKDTRWLENFWGKFFPNKSYDDVTLKEFGEVLQTLKPGNEPKDWVIGNLQRDPNTGSFDDGALANILQSATEDMAHAFRARGVPAVFKVIEILGIVQARKWGSCTLNEFRSFLGLKTYSDFKEWNPDPEIYKAAEQLYHHIDNLELYVGMQAEETRPSIPGSGLCSGYTMSRAILADALALIRGDRFLTVEYTPFNLTSWGYRDAQSDDNNGSLGGMLTKLLLRAFPRHYFSGSIHAHFPFVVPVRMRQYLSVQKELESRYNFDRQPPLSPVRIVNSFPVVEGIVIDRGRFSIPYHALAASLTKGYGFYLCMEESPRSQQDKVMIEEALFSPESIKEYAKFYHEVTRTLIVDKAIALVRGTTRVVDIVAHVINYVPVHWVARRVANLSLSTMETPDGKYTEQELYSYLAALFTYIFLTPDSVNKWTLEQEASKAADALLKDIRKNLEESSAIFPHGIRGALASLVHGNVEHQGGDRLLRYLSERNRNLDTNDLVYNIFGVLINSVANWAHAMTHVINFYLDDARKGQKDHIVELSSSPLTEESERSLISYAREALRFDPPVAGVFRDVRVESELSQTHFQVGETVVVNLASALVEEAQANPITNPRAASDLEFVIGAHSSLNKKFSEQTMAHVLHAVYGKKNLRRAPGTSGRLDRFTTDLYGTPQKLYIDKMGYATRLPQSLLVQFDV